MIGRRIRIRGLVQGVCYRAWAADAARALGLAGWVRNRSDGSVEALLLGDPGAVSAFIAACRQGPPAARVDGIEQEEAPASDIEGFTLRPTA
jgi:acylphosphatase